ncbi:MAG: glycosyltransferase family 4 protein [Asgard group archaeon]|nr:glycosyltransferase family 4 protein [Asgard group archaeon]
MKICMVTDTYHPIFDGIVRYMDYLVPELLRQGHEVTIVCPHFPGYKHIESPISGLKIVRSFTTKIKVNAYYFALPDRRLYRAIKESDFVVLHSLMPLGVAGGLIAKILRKKVGLFCHHDERVILQNIMKAKPFIIRFCYRLIRNFYKSVINVFFHATERFRRKLIFFGVPSEKIIHTPFAINKKTFHPTPEINLRQRFDLPENALLVTYLGRLSIEKNVDNIIKAMDAALDEQPNLYALIVGGGPDKEKFMNQERQNKDRFIFTGFIPEEELQSHYASSDIFVTPTLNESSCFTVFEAMTCQVPIITAAKDHDPDIVHNQNALLVEDVLNYQEIKENILSLSSDTEFRQMVALKGYQLIENRTWENHANRFLIGLENLQGSKQSSSKFISKTENRQKRFWKRLRKVIGL